MRKAKQQAWPQSTTAQAPLKSLRSMNSIVQRVLQPK
jgi:hypothetical protein